MLHRNTVFLPVDAPPALLEAVLDRLEAEEGFPLPRAEPMPESPDECEFGDDEYQWRLWQAGL